MVWHPVSEDETDPVDGTSDVILKEPLSRSLFAAAEDLLMECKEAPQQIQHSAPALRFANGITDGLLRLRRPAPFRNIIQNVAYVQRFWLLLRGYLTYFVNLAMSSATLPSLNAPVPRALPLIGVFTNNIDIVEILQRMRIPVWFLRFHHQVHHTDIFYFCKTSETLGWWVTTDLGSFGQLAYKGTLGNDYITWYGSKWSHFYSDIDSNPFSPRRPSDRNFESVGPASRPPKSTFTERSTRLEKKVVKGRTHPCMFTFHSVVLY